MNTKVPNNPKAKAKTFKDLFTINLLLAHNTHIRGSNTWAKIRAKRQSLRVFVPARLRATTVVC
ncbi:MAG TPA: hypothetical protein DGF36_12830 [Alteromonas sp.]|nr:hypothetical protein [Alteromonas sp.]